MTHDLERVKLVRLPRSETYGCSCTQVLSIMPEIKPSKLKSLNFSSVAIQDSEECPSFQTAELIPDYLPPLIPNTWMAPQDIVRVDRAFDREQAGIVGAPKGALEVGFVRIGLLY